MAMVVVLLLVSLLNMTLASSNLFRVIVLAMRIVVRMVLVVFVRMLFVMALSCWDINVFRLMLMSAIFILR